MTMAHEVQEIIIYEYTCMYKKKGQVRKSREIQVNWANIFLTKMRDTPQHSGIHHPKYFYYIMNKFYDIFLHPIVSNGNLWLQVLIL